MARRSAPDRDEREHPLRGQRHGVGRGEVVGDEDERGVALGDSGHRLPEQPGDRSIADVVEVPDALGHVAAEIEEHGAEAADCAVDCPGPGLALGGRRSDRLLEGGVAGDHGGRLEHLGGAGDRGRRGATLEVLGGQDEGGHGRAGFGIGVGDVRAIGRKLWRRPHERHRPRREAGADADALEWLRGRRCGHCGIGGRHGPQAGSSWSSATTVATASSASLGALAIGLEDHGVAVPRPERQDAEDAPGVDRGRHRPCGS